MNIYKSLVTGTLILIIIFSYIQHSTVVKANETEEGDWLQFRHDRQHTGYQPMAGNGEILKYNIKWYNDYCEPNYDHNLIYHEPSVTDIDLDGEKEILFGLADGNLYCLNTEGGTNWNYKSKGSISATPTLANLDNSADLEIIFSDQSGAISVLTSNGDLIWEYQTDDTVDASAAIGDITGNGEPDIIIGSLDSNIYVLNNKGDLIWKYDTENWVEGSAVVIDINSDGTNEVIVGNGNGILYAITTKKEVQYENIPRLRKEEFVPYVLWEFQTQQVDNIGFVNSPVVIDLDHDGNYEILCGGADGKLYCLNKSGKELWRYHSGSPIYAEIAVGDIDHDEESEIVFCSGDSIIAIDSSGDLLWKRKFSMRIGSNPTISDLDGDGYLEITAIDESWVTLGPAVSSEEWINSSNILNYKGETVHKLRFNEIGYDYVYGVSIADLENDGKLEILAGTSKGYLYCYSEVYYKIEVPPKIDDPAESDANEDNSDNGQPIPAFDLILVLLSLIVTFIVMKQSRKKIHKN